MISPGSVDRDRAVGRTGRGRYRAVQIAPLKLIVFGSILVDRCSGDDFQRRCVVDVVDRHADGFDHLGAVVVGGGDGDRVAAVEVLIRRR